MGAFDELVNGNDQGLTFEDLGHSAPPAPKNKMKTKAVAGPLDSLAAKYGDTPAGPLDALARKYGDTSTPSRKYTVTHPTTGKTVTITGPTAPSEADLDRIFAAVANQESTSRTKNQAQLQREFALREGTPTTAARYGIDRSPVDDVPVWGREHPNLYALYKTATGGIDLSAPTAPAESVKDWATRVVPESTVKTAIGAVTAPYQMIKNVTDPIVEYAGNITKPSPRMQLAGGIDQGMKRNLDAAADFLGKPLGFKRGDSGEMDWSPANIKDALLTDPVGSAAALAPTIGALKGARAELAGLKPVPNAAKLNAELDRSYTKAIRPSVTGNRTSAQANGYAENARTAVKEIVLNRDKLNLVDEMGEPVDGLPHNLQQFRSAIDQTKRNIWGKVEAINSEAGKAGAEVPLRSAVDELNALADKPVYRTMAPDTVRYATDRARALDEQGSFSVGDAQDAITMANQSLQNFYRNPSADTASRAYVDSLIANHLRANLDTALETATGSQAAAPLRKAYAALKAIEKDVNRRATVDARKNDRGLVDFSDIMTAGELVKAMATLNPAGMAKAGAMAAVKSLIKRANDPNHHVRKVFKAGDALVKKFP
ncbi:hypothetical protein KP005_19345 [Geomonas nitrogeniifigens]|uniref:Large polyvalent protein associated domain-containing protein n=1 Tax=Geomonas diazotrophica TaxID=2843197 RepID=A0ABX8JGF0_9BACT|nr:hypothetical protein [Geomonas nitrogeniifigens]QWV97463.1 hypothetical protein KP005_19345 [Geomonas nitrogeniifigens]